ncbi:hypothetical protein J6590_091846 [Homalodisca vitripennis]|nr:hypothetical protein J6590_091846 [Homalodisca vitripennis]
MPMKSVFLKTDVTSSDFAYLNFFREVATVAASLAIANMFIRAATLQTRPVVTAVAYSTSPGGPVPDHLLIFGDYLNSSKKKCSCAVGSGGSGKVPGQGYVAAPV